MSGDAQGPGPYRRPAASPPEPDGPDPATLRPAERHAVAEPEAYRWPDDGDSDVDAGAAYADAPEPALPPEALRPRRSRPWFGRLLLAGAGLGVAALAAWMVDSAIAAAGAGSPVALLTAAALGAIALGLAGLTVRELAGLARVRNRARIRAAVERAEAGANVAETERALRLLAGLHGGRPELAWALARYREAAADVPDAPDRLALYEQRVQAPVDRAAVAEIRAVARRVAVLTALSPNPFLDAAVVLWLNLSVIRRVAQVQGLRPGLLASGALIRRTLLTMIAAGGMEGIGDFAPEAVATGLVRGLAKRVGEGAVNGLLTIRLGLAALDACRPMPFNATPRPSAATLARQALGGESKPRA